MADVRTPAQEERDALDTKLHDRYMSLSDLERQEIHKQLALYHMSGNEDWVACYLACGLGRYTASQIKGRPDYRNLEVKALEDIMRGREKRVILKREQNSDRVYFKDGTETPGTLMMRNFDKLNSPKNEDLKKQKRDRKPIKDWEIADWFEELELMLDDADVQNKSSLKYAILQQISKTKGFSNEVTEAEYKKKITEEGMKLVKKVENQIKQFKAYEGKGERIDFGDDFNVVDETDKYMDDDDE